MTETTATPPAETPTDAVVSSELPTKGRMLFVNLPITDQEATRAFWTALGFSFNESFCDQNTLCLEINAHSAVMLLQQDFFHGFYATTGPAAGTDGVLMCLSAATREDVTTLLNAAVAAGGTKLRDGEEPYPMMFSAAFRDLDGHVWEIMWTDPAAFA